MVGWENNLFSSKMRQINLLCFQGLSRTSQGPYEPWSISRKPQEIRPKLYVTNRKLHMRFRMTPRLTTLDDLELL